MKQTLVLAIKSVSGLDKTRCFYSCLKLLVNYHIWITNAPSGLSFSFYPFLSASSCLVFLKVFLLHERVYSQTFDFKIA